MNKYFKRFGQGNNIPNSSQLLMRGGLPLMIGGALLFALSQSIYYGK